MKESFLRSISGILIVAVMLSFIYSKSFFYSFSFIFVIGMFMAMEWNDITKIADDKRKWVFYGIAYISVSLLPLLKIKTLYKGNSLLMWLFLLVWFEDTFAYFIGTILDLGKHKISKISPNKSYEGLFGGMIAATIFCDTFASIFLSEYRIILLFFTPIFCCLEQASDFTESYVKRKFNVKDSGDIIPGHGGFLDRFDGFLYISLSLLYILQFY